MIEVSNLLQIFKRFMIAPVLIDLPYSIAAPVGGGAGDHYVALVPGRSSEQAAL